MTLTSEQKKLLLPCILQDTEYCVLTSSSGQHIRSDSVYVSGSTLTITVSQQAFDTSGAVWEDCQVTGVGLYNKNDTLLLKRSNLDIHKLKHAGLVVQLQLTIGEIYE